MLRVLFVDDEPNILQGIKRATRTMRQLWEMHFAESGEEALALLSHTEVDVIVSDMRMPGMDGAELLSRVRAISPGAARIVLSGYAEEEIVFRSTKVAHLFLSKPCDLDELTRTIEEIRACRDTVEPDAIRDLVGKIDQLPALGDVYAELTQAIERETSSCESLGQIVSKDVALTAELLRLINSAFFGLSRKVESVAQAIGFLGVEVVRAIVAGHSIFSTNSGGMVDIDAIAARGQAVAALARASVPKSGAPASVAAEAYLAGMLHEIGVLVLSDLPDIDPDELRAVLVNGDLTNERLAFGVDRFTIGAYLLGLWGFAPSIVQAVSALALPADMDSDPVIKSVRLAYEVVISGEAQIDVVDADHERVLEILDRAESELRRHGHFSPLVEQSP